MMPKKQKTLGQRTDTQILDALEALPDRIDIIYKRGIPRTLGVPSLRQQINSFLDAESAALIQPSKGRK